MNSRFDTRLISLARRKSTPAMKAHLLENDFESVAVVNAIDGSTLDYGEMVKSGIIGAGQKKEMSKGEYGCALSHVQVWRDFLLHPGKDNLLVFEDDIRLKFKRACFEKLDLPADMDLLQLGWKGGTAMTVDPHKEIQRVPDNFNVPFGAFAYILSRKGAARLVRMSRIVNLESDGFFRAGHDLGLCCYVHTSKMVEHRINIASSIDHGTPVALDS